MSEVNSGAGVGKKKYILEEGGGGGGGGWLGGGQIRGNTYASFLCLISNFREALSY